MCVGEWVYVCALIFTAASALTLAFVGFIKDNPHLEVVCRAGFPSLG